MRIRSIVGYVVLGVLLGYLVMMPIGMVSAYVLIALDAGEEPWGVLWFAAMVIGCAVLPFLGALTALAVMVFKRV